MAQPSSGPRVIAHLDMNTFFVSVERLKDPELEGQPVAVGGKPGGRSVVSSASYEARRYGIHSAMPMDEAVRRCPDLLIVSPGFSDYKHFHDQIKTILADFTPIVEMTSIDEGYLDLTGTEKLWGLPPDAGRQIRERILNQTALPSSIGISANKLVSKVASDLAKPAGDPRKGDPAATFPDRHAEPVEVRRPGSHEHEFKGDAPPLDPARHPLITSEGVLVIPPGREAGFLAPLPLSHLPGCGKMTIPRLQAMDLQTIGDLAACTEDELGTLFGEMGRSLWRRANGRGSQIFSTEHQRKSISKERTFTEDVTDRDHLRAILHRLTEGIAFTLRRRNENARTVTLKLRYDDFETHTFSRSLPAPTDVTIEIFDTASVLLAEHWARDRSIRLIGIGVSNLMKGRQQEDMFAQIDQKDNSRRLEVIDDIRTRFGKDSLLTGESLNLLKKEHS
jgi:DNA polymerase-4